MTIETPHQTDLHEYLRVVRARRWEIGLLTLVVVLAVTFFTWRQTPIYEGQAKVLVNPVQNPTSSAVVVQPNLDTERQLALSQAVAESARRILGVTTSARTLVRGVSAEVVTNTTVLIISYRSPSADIAARYANAFAQAYVDFRTSQAQRLYDAAASAVQKQIQGVQDSLAALNQKINATTDPKSLGDLGAQRDTLLARAAVLTQQLLTIQANSSVVQGSAAQIVQRAAVPTSPVTPKKVRNVVMALFAGLVLGIGLAFLRERLDDRLKSRQEIERRLGAPVLAVVPRVSTWRKSDEAYLALRSEPKSPVSEAYRTLATNVQYLGFRESIKVLVVTSALAGDGKTTTCANLAVALAESGKKVILISADLRKPRLHRFFGLTNDVGLTSILAGAAEVQDGTTDPGHPNLRVMAGGPVPTNPASLLAGSRISEVIGALREICDFIIVDTPPVLAVADASILAPNCDAILLVMDAARARRSSMAQAKSQLETAGGRIIGAVLNNFDPTQSRGYSDYYYYSQYYQYYEEEPSGANGTKDRAGKGSKNGSRGFVTTKRTLERREPRPPAPTAERPPPTSLDDLFAE
jgi:capsular exopolysaccharide synthesis family protein